MSNSSSVANIFPAGLSLTGGIPLQSQDLAASIVFAAAYIIILPLGLWRICASSSRCFALLRPLIFIIARIGTYIVRAIIAKGHYAKTLFIIEQILLLCGFILLCEPLITLLGFHIIRNYIPTGSPKPLLQRIQAVLKLALLAALILGVYAGSQIGSVKSDGSDQGTVNTIKTCRDANVIISLVIVVLAAFVSIGAYFKETPKIPFFASMHLVTISVFLAIASIYKMAFYYSHASPISRGTKIGFYFGSALPEFIACLLLFIVNLNTTYEIREALQKQKDDKKMRDGTYTGAGYQTQMSYGAQPAQGVSYPPNSYPPQQQQQNYYPQGSQNV